MNGFSHLRPFRSLLKGFTGGALPRRGEEKSHSALAISPPRKHNSAPEMYSWEAKVTTRQSKSWTELVEFDREVDGQTQPLMNGALRLCKQPGIES